MEIMFALVALSVMLAALAPMLAKKVSRSMGTLNSASSIATDRCKTLINANCYVCNVATKECLGCGLTCTTGTLNVAKCECQ